MIAIEDYFTDRKRFQRLFTVLCGTMALLKGLRLPYSWAYTQAQIDYRYGLIRRGFFGASCRFLGIDVNNYRIFTILSVVILASFLFLLFRAVLSGPLRKIAHGYCVTLIAASFCLTYLVNLVGYLDILMALIVLLGIRLSRFGAQVVFAIVAGIIGVLIHELYLVAFLPVSLIGLIYETECGNRHDILKRASGLLAAGLIPVALAVFLFLHRPLIPAQIEAFRISAHANGTSGIQDSFFEVLSRPLHQSFSDMAMRMRAGRWWLYQADTALAFFPTAMFFIFVSSGFLSREARVTRAAIVFSVFSPMLLSFVGADFARWMALCTLNSFLAALRCSGVSPESKVSAAISRPVLGTATRRVAVVLIALNLATNVGLFDGSGNNFPFLEHLVQWRNDLDAHQLPGVR